MESSVAGHWSTDVQLSICIAHVEVGNELAIAVISWWIGYGVWHTKQFVCLSGHPATAEAP